MPIEVRRIVDTLNALLDRVSRRISSKDEFISNAAHQLRNPVAGVLALAEAVQSAPSTKAAKKRSAELVQAARETSNLTNQLLSFERASGADLSRTSETLDFRDLLHQVTETFSLQNRGSKAEVATIFPDVEVPVRVDAILLQEAILNLLTNAVVHGGPEMSKITLRLSCRQGTAVLLVEDDGAGIPADKHIEAISRFGQANGGPGSGLGLPIAARVMKNHGGSLEIYDFAEGARIILSLPVTTFSAETAAK